MLVRFFKVCPELADVVDYYWTADIKAHTDTTQKYCTPIMETMIFNFSNLKEYYRYKNQVRCLTGMAYFFGQSTSPTVIYGKQENDGYILGVRFKPLGFAKITGINIQYLSDNVTDAEDIWGNGFKWLCEAMQEVGSVTQSIVILENFFKRQMKFVQLNERSEVVHTAISMMQAHHGKINGKKLQSELCICKKTFERLFANYQGIKPKLYNSIIRFNEAKRLMVAGNGTNLAQVAYQVGYFDQSHFIKDFKRFADLTPTAYLKTIEEERLKRTIPLSKSEQ